MREGNLAACVSEIGPGPQFYGVVGILDVTTAIFDGRGVGGGVRTRVHVGAIDHLAGTAGGNVVGRRLGSKIIPQRDTAAAGVALKRHGRRHIRRQRVRYFNRLRGMVTGVGVSHLPLNGVSGAALIIRVHLIRHPVGPLGDVLAPLGYLHFRFRGPGGHEKGRRRATRVRVAHGAGLVEIGPCLGLFVGAFVAVTSVAGQLRVKGHPHPTSRVHGPVPFGIFGERGGEVKLDLLLSALCAGGHIHRHVAAFVGGRFGFDIFQTRREEFKEFQIIDVGLASVLRSHSEG